MKEIKQVYQYLTDAFLKDFIEESIDCCEKAIQLIPQFSLSYLMLVLFYLKKNDVDTAQKYYLVFREYNPNLEFEVGYEIEEILTAFILKHFIQLKSPYVNDKLEDLMSIRPPIEKAFVFFIPQL